MLFSLLEAIRNAVIHRDYSLRGKDIKIAIFDDKIEISSPGKLLHSIDFDDMESGQSDIRNKTLAPVFKKLGIIEQWGNGLQLIADELKAYPEIEFQWSEPGIAFRVTFLKKNYNQQLELQQESLYSKVLGILISDTLSTQDISEALGQKSISGQTQKLQTEIQAHPKRTVVLQTGNQGG